MASNLKQTTVSKNDKFRILVYGIERAGYAQLSTMSIGNNIELVFEDFNTKEEFQNYNGVIMFQGIWVKRKSSNEWYEARGSVGEKETNELVKRTKQLQQLVAVKNGFVCFLMGRMTHDDFDLAKNVLNWFPQTYFEAIGDKTFVSAKRGELKIYCDKYGVGKTQFSHYGSGVDFEVLLTTGTYDGNVGVVFDNRIFFLPYHAPDKDEEATKELFNILGKGMTSLFKKMLQELPEWVSSYSFQNESHLKEEKEGIKSKLAEVNTRLETYYKYKSILYTHSDSLRENVSFVLSSGFGYEVDSLDEFREDLKIVLTKAKSGVKKTLALIEVKGLNGNVDREAINQVDSHRERGGFESSFPGILIVNTFIKSSNTLGGKLKEINKEQVIHAHKNHVLILRTIDLLNALNLSMQNAELKKRFDALLLIESGWLEVNEKEMLIHHE